MTSSSSPAVLVPRDDWDYIIAALRCANARLGPGAAVTMTSEALGRIADLSVWGDSSLQPSASVPAPADGQVASQPDWLCESGHNSVLLYTLRDTGHWRMGEPILANDTTIRIERAYGSDTPIEPIVETILSALSPTDQSSDVSGLVEALERAQRVLDNTAVSNAIRMVGAHEIITQALAQAKRDAG